MYKNKKTGIMGIIITSIILIILVIFTSKDASTFSGAENVFNKIVMPIQNGLTYLKNKIAGNNTFFEDINNLKSENENLKNQITELNEKLSELEIIKAENAYLREYSNLTDIYTEHQTVPAYIIDRDISNLSDTFIINVGKKDNVDVNMPVVSAEGLVGYTISVTESTAKVQPIIDPASRVSAVMAVSRNNVMTKGILGSTNTLQLTYIPTDADLVIGDTIETSGLRRYISKRHKNRNIIRNSRN